jgi:CheY-like chemotaxis protein
MSEPRPVVLVIDDDAALCTTVRRMLERAGYLVETASAGAEGMTRLAAGGIDVVLLDLLLPDLDGRELCRRIRADESRGYVPVIMLTGVPDAAARQEGSRPGPMTTSPSPSRPRTWWPGSMSG